jgi:hypothetical protein
MFSLFDYFFRPKKRKELGDKTLYEFVLQETRQKDFEQIDKLQDGEVLFNEAMVNQSIVYTRQDLTLISALMTETNILLRWIRFLLLFLIIILVVNFSK